MMLMLLLVQPLQRDLGLGKYVRLSVVLHGATDQLRRRLQGNALREPTVRYSSHYE